jgi:uncharacterized protein YbjT (DUF2867 family)
VEERIVLITGATGHQGGATARELVGKGFKLRGMTRKPEGEAAKALARLGIEIVKGDLNDETSLRAALKGCWGTYAVQNTWEAGVEGEEEQGKRFARIAKEAGIRHYVYASVASAQRKTGIPHFENKWRIEETVRGLRFPSYSIVRPVFFMENLTSPWFLNGDKLPAAMDPKTVLQMIAVEDIGKYAAHAFTHAKEMNGVEVDIAGDQATMPAAAEALSRGLGRKIEFLRLPIEDVRRQSDDLAAMLEWFDRVGYDVDIPATSRKYGFPPTSLEAWAKKQRASVPT